MKSKLATELAGLLAELERAGTPAQLRLLVSLSSLPEQDRWRELGFRVEHVAESLPMASGEVSSAQVPALAQWPEVTRIELDGEVQAYRTGGPGE